MEQKYADIIKLGTSALSDAMDRLGIPGQALGIKPVDRSFLVCGPAFTVHNMPCDIHGGSVGDYIDDVAGRAGHRHRQRRPPRLHRVGRHPHRHGLAEEHRRHRDQRRLPRLRPRPGGQLPDLQQAAPTCAPARTASWPTPTTPRSRWARSRSCRATSICRRRRRHRRHPAGAPRRGRQGRRRDRGRRGPHPRLDQDGMSLLDARTQFNYHALQTRR